ncbi:translocase of chloroplast 34-like protein [Cinnamomum micranthum f. kanehirae]|uniref:Translocase of chloroplast 34-like protein n=1 Tax=Cinnamomum micranthum f. kanehirae TaxID=337451 RepID=A0A443PAV8_9MAGN|nr:translocase of chloroplast 34-like protein [Cinnamomum micranthum f. kanehirae]
MEEENEQVGPTRVLPNSTAWIPHLVKMITEVISNGSKSVEVDKKLIEGPNPNDESSSYLSFWPFSFEHDGGSKPSPYATQLPGGCPVMTLLSRNDWLPSSNGKLSNWMTDSFDARGSLRSISSRLT